MSLPYCNNLRLGDEVEIASSKRRGIVTTQPRQSSAGAQVRVHGLKTALYYHVSNLRLVVDGKAEDVPPIDGEVPVRPDERPKAHNPAHCPVPCPYCGKSVRVYVGIHEG